MIINERVSLSDIRGLRVGSKIWHKDFKDGPLVVTSIENSSPKYSNEYGMSYLFAKSADGNQYMIAFDTETLRRENRVGQELYKISKIVR